MLLGLSTAIVLPVLAEIAARACVSRLTPISIRWVFVAVDHARRCLLARIRSCRGRASDSECVEFPSYVRPELFQFIA